MKFFSLFVELSLSYLAYPALCHQEANENKEFKPLRVGHAYSSDFERVRNETLKNYLKDRIKEVLSFLSGALMALSKADNYRKRLFGSRELISSYDAQMTREKCCPHLCAKQNILNNNRDCGHARFRANEEELHDKDIVIFIDASTTDSCEPGSRTLAYAIVCQVDTLRDDRGLLQRTRTWKVNDAHQLERTTNVIASRKVQHFVRTYFNCNDAEGAELENDGGIGTAGSHWEKRLFGPEIMTGVQSRKGVFSGLTAALLEDTGWYKVNQSMIEELEWAKDLGCTFAMRSCREFIESKPAQPGAAYPYCNWEDFISGRGRKQTLRRCDRKRRSAVQCNFAYNNTITAEYAYFLGKKTTAENMDVVHGTSVTGADKYTDHCPMWQDVYHGDKSSHFGDMICDNSGNRPDSKHNMGLEIYGDDSICIEQKSIFVMMECIPPKLFNLVQAKYDSAYGAGCYQYRCENGRLMIRGAGNEDDVGAMQYKVCWAKGAKIFLIRLLKDENGNPAALHRGTLVCPSCKEICENNGFICEPDVPGIHARDRMSNPCVGCRHVTAKWIVSVYVLGSLLFSRAR